MAGLEPPPGSRVCAAEVAELGVPEAVMVGWQQQAGLTGVPGPKLSLAGSAEAHKTP